MSSCKEYLKELEFYCMVEDGLEDKKSTNRKQYNFRRIMNDLMQKKHDEAIKARYDNIIAKSKAFVGKLGIVHNTGLDSIISIIQNGALLSVDEMEKRDISFNFRISFRGINDEMQKYVFGATGKGDSIYGLYEIRFKKEIESAAGAQFIPQSNLRYGAEVLKDYFMDIKDWRTYLSEYIALSMDEPENYIKEIPLHNRPEFLFENQIPVSLIDSIVCASATACNKLKETIVKEFGEGNEILKKIKVAGE